MEDYQVWLQAEQQELAAKVERLSKLLHNDVNLETLDPLQADLMHAQMHVMASYLAILAMRMQLMGVPLKGV